MAGDGSLLQLSYGCLKDCAGCEMMSNDIRQEMVELGRRLYDRGLLAATEGNYSVRLDDQRVLATPSGLCKGLLQADDLVIIDGNGNHLEGERKVSSEILMHLEVYRRRPDVSAVVHAHPPHCIALMLAGKGLDRPILAEQIILMGRIPIAPYARPSTPQVPASLEGLIERTDYILLDRHGSLTVGGSLQEAFFKLDSMEHTARSYLAALQLGDVREFPAEEIAELNRLRRSRYGINWPVIDFCYQ